METTDILETAIAEGKKICPLLARECVHTNCAWFVDHGGACDGSWACALWHMGKRTAEQREWR